MWGRGPKKWLCGTWPRAEWCRYVCVAVCGGGVGAVWSYHDMLLMVLDGGRGTERILNFTCIMVGAKDTP